MSSEQSWMQIVTWIVAFSGWGKIIFDSVTSNPRVQGRILTVMRGIIPHQGKQLALFTPYLYLLNRNRNSVHLLDYELEIEIMEGQWIRLHRAYNMHSIQQNIFPDKNGGAVKIEKFSENLIYRKNAPLEYGKPLHGWITFAGPEELYDITIKRYRITCIDAYCKKYKFVAREDQFENFFLVQEMAGISLPNSISENKE